MPGKTKSKVVNGPKNLLVPDYVWEMAHQHNQGLEEPFESVDAYLLDRLLTDMGFKGVWAPPAEDHPSPSITDEDVQRVKRVLQRNGISVSCMPEPNKEKTLDKPQPCFIEDHLTEDAEELHQAVFVRFCRDGRHFNRPVKPYYARVLRRIVREEQEAGD